MIQRRYDHRGASQTGSTGLGLANIRDRLAQTYGEDHRFEIATPPEGGFTVIIEIPYEVHREADALEDAEKPTALTTVTEVPGERAMGTNA